MRSPAKKKVLFVYKGQRLSDFKQLDLALLRSMYNTREFYFEDSRRYLALLVLGIIWADIAFIWFADKHSWYTVRLCKLLRKKSIIVTGGYDIANLPNINYGLTTRGEKYRSLVEESLNLCDRIIANSQSAVDEVYSNFIVNKDKLCLVYHGVDSSRYLPDQSLKKSNIAITVGSIFQHNLKRKGLETFVKSAQYAPDFQFFLIGKWVNTESVNYLKQIATPNVELVGYLSVDELIRMYQEAKVYVQVSHHEGFGLSLAEAMLCECAPVVTEVGSIPEVVGECGYYVPLDNPIETALQIKKAAKSPLGVTARHRIAKKFTMEKRKQGLMGVIESL